MISNLYTTNDMMKRINKFYYYILSLFLFTACQEEALMDKTAGFQISLQDGEVAIETKSTPVELGKPAVDKFKLKIVREGVSEPLYEGAYTSQTIPASAGTYAIAASYGDNPVLAWDAPYYFGDTTKVVIKEGEQKSISLKCKVANALASVSFPADAELQKIFSSYWVKVVVGDLSCKLTSDSKRSAYFQAGKQVTFYFEGKKTNGADFSEELKHKDLPSILEAGHNVKLTLKLSDDLLLDIAKVEVKKETITSDIPMDWLPRPKIEAEGFENNVLAFAETESKTAKLNLNTASALQDLKLKFTFGDPQFESLNDKEYLLSVPTDKEKVEKVLGIVLPEIGAEKASLDLTSIVSKLQTNAGTTVENKIEVDAKANNRWSSETVKDQENPNRVYTLRCNKPIFRVNAYPGNVWTKEFTMNPLMEEQVESGDFTILSKDIKYQFSLDGQSGWTDISADLRKADLTPGTNYFIRGLYRGQVASEVAEVKTYPIIELENGNLSSYSVVRGEDGNKRKGYGAQFEWSSWATLNELTTPNCPITAYSYNTRSGTRPVSDIRIGANDNVAVWIITIGYGGNSSNPKAVTPSELFLGKYNEKGIEFASHPTGLHFWYKYHPFKGDLSDISISLFSGEQEIGKGILQEENEVSSYKDCILQIIYDEKYKHLSPDRISIVFKSGFNSEVESRESGSLTSSNTANPKFRGSELYIDDISLIYDK